MTFVSQKFHAYLDYPVAIALLVLPFLLGLGSNNSLALWVSVVTGGVAFLLTLFTDHELGLFRVIPFAFHLKADLLVGLAFLVIPFALSFHGLEAWFYWLNGAAVLAVVSMDNGK